MVARVSTAKKAWDSLLADVLRGTPRKRGGNRPHHNNLCVDVPSEGHGIDGRETCRLTGMGSQFFARDYHNGRTFVSKGLDPGWSD